MRSQCSWMIAAMFLLLTPHLGTMATGPGDGEDSTSSIINPQEYNSCGFNMECVPRRLCRNDIVDDRGFTLISPRIGDFQDCNYPFRCCSVDKTTEALLR